MSNEFNKYLLFLKAAEIGNISRAAEALNYTQSGVSHAIHALEEEMGFPLFIRGKNGVRLTPKGKQVFPEIQALVNQHRKLDQLVAQMNHNIEGHLRVGAFTSAIALILPDIISSFTKENPGVFIELFHGDYQEIEKGVEQGTFDCGLISGDPSLKLDVFEVMNDEIKGIVSKDHELANKKRVTIKEFIKNPLILQSSGYSYDVEKILSPYKGDVDIRYELSDNIEVMYLVAKNHGVGIIPKLMLEIGNAEVHTLSFNPPVYRRINIIAPFPEHRNVVTNAFIEWICSHKRATY